MRGLLLWCATNPWLAAHVPQWGFVRRAVRRFMPGEEFQDALKVAVEWKPRKIGALFTQLGENITDLAEAAAVVQHFEVVLTRAAEAHVDPVISVKPTHVGLDIDGAAALANLQRLAGAAEKAGGWLWIDMEGSAYTDATLDLYTEVRKKHQHVGLAMQAYLYRTASDVARLLELKPAIRLVKGAYAEPADRAFPAKQPGVRRPGPGIEDQLGIAAERQHHVGRRIRPDPWERQELSFQLRVALTRRRLAGAAWSP